MPNHSVLPALSSQTSQVNPFTTSIITLNNLGLKGGSNDEHRDELDGFPGMDGWGSSRKLVRCMLLTICQEPPMRRHATWIQ